MIEGPLIIVFLRPAEHSGFMFFEPKRTPYDVQFRLFDIPVRVHPMFWLVAAILGWNAQSLGFPYLLTWIGCMFVSILVHELGHVFVGRYFGSQGHIVLYAMGGLAINSNNLHRNWQRIAVCFAGPGAGFLLLAGLLAFLFAADRERFDAAVALVQSFLGIGSGIRLGRTLWDAAILFLVQINLLWGLLNLLPIWPLDGGQISRDVCGAIFPGRGLRISLGISFVVAGLLAVHCLMDHYGRPLIPNFQFGSMPMALFFGLFAVQSFLLMQQAQRSYRPWDDWGERDPTIWR